jgi:ribosomal protein S18 acetylase RimI-like enzyme
MEPSARIVVEKATLDDAEEILALQKLAYVSEAEIIDDFTIPPLHQTLDEIRCEFEHQVVLKVQRDNRILGSVRCYMEGGTCYIGKLIVHPDHQNRGLGTTLLQAAEGTFPTAERFELFTGERSAKNLHIYGKAGYRGFRSRVVSPKLTLVYLEKINRLVPESPA